MAESGLELPLLQPEEAEQLDQTREDDSDYILVFYNPFSQREGIEQL